MIGGVTLNGQEIYSPLQECEKLENEIRSTFELNLFNDDRHVMPVNHYFQGGRGIGNEAEKKDFTKI